MTEDEELHHEPLPLTEGMLAKFLLELALETPTLGQERTVDWYARQIYPFWMKYAEAYTASRDHRVKELEEKLEQAYRFLEGETGLKIAFAERCAELEHRLSEEEKPCPGCPVCKPSQFHSAKVVAKYYNSGCPEVKEEW